MHFKHILLASSLAFWSSPVVAQSGLSDLGSGLGPIEGGSLLGKRLEKEARRASVKASTTPDDQGNNGKGPTVMESPGLNERDFNAGSLVEELLGESSSSSTTQPTGTPSPRITKKGLGMLDDLLGEVLPELAPSSSGAASATPTPSATPTSFDPFIKRVETSDAIPVKAPDAEPTKAPSPNLVKKQLGILSELESELEGLAGGSSSAAGSSTPAPSATPSPTPSKNPPPFYSSIKRQSAVPSSSSDPMGVVKELMNARDEIPGYESSTSGSGFDLSNGDGQNAEFSSDSHKESVDPFFQPDPFEKRQYPDELPGYESSASHSESAFDNGDGQDAKLSSGSDHEAAHLPGPEF
ncbi:hypothetical protein N7478_007894 [Penicillium angulare]|uniref:uncharacterized protein n=1 Tax=Penicillium angulare TaxID=116970 RepID=UPI002540E2F2|nr:uncharacterized protein N7478_007894 [Penicillium angulare]KAJ5272769.1 hypothetical protein N7478_007894 [Penicillium angulare]